MEPESYNEPLADALEGISKLTEESESDGPAMAAMLKTIIEIAERGLEGYRQRLAA